MRIAYWSIAVAITGSLLLFAREPEAPHTGASSPEHESGAVIDLSEGDQARFFDAHIAPLLARHCLECHDSTSKKGRLDLSRKEAALADRRGGKTIVPGNAAESLLWQSVESDEMPEDRPPLSPEEKELLREWINAGAIWSAEEIDPLALTRDRRAAMNWVLRLTVPEYIETVRSAVGVNIEEDALRILPKDLRADGFGNTGYNLQADLEHVEAYAKLAEMIVERMDVPAFAAEHVSCDKHSPCQEFAESCMRQVVSGIGKWLFRGPLEEHEITAFLAVPDVVAAEGGDYAEAVGYIIEGMLQSPRFLYRIETQRGDGTVRRVNDYELASRLSYILWGGPPDKELMRAADAGELADNNGVQEQVQRMLEDPRVIERSARFVYEWLDLDRLGNLRPNPERFPKWDDRLGADMREETLAFFQDVVGEQKRPLADLLNAQITFLTPRLAEHYGLEPKPVEKKSPEIQLADGPKHTANGLLAFYRFHEGGGNVVRDSSGAGEALHLKIADPGAVRWTDDGLAIHSGTLIASEGPPARLIEGVRDSGEMTLEAWITPANNTQAGPARILSLSSGSNQRNFTLGQIGDKYEVRFRARGTDSNGLPGVSSPSGSVETRLTQVVYTRDKEGNAKIYLNGEEAGHIESPTDLSNWDRGFHLYLGNESTQDRPWQGTFHRIAIYNRALTAEEVTASSPRLARYELSSVPSRGGLLTHGSLLTIGGDEASMVTRGLFVLRDFLFSTVGSAPPGADTTPVPTKPGLTQRAVAEARLADRSCGGCHSRFEPLAFGLEKFDGLGAFHERDEHGNELRDDGEILFPGEEEPRSYSSSSELMDLLAGSERVHKNLTRKLTQFALGRPLVESDARVIDEIHETAQQDGGTYVSLITAIVTSDLVQMTRTETERE
jgi:hypothetical protein